MCKKNGVWSPKALGHTDLTYADCPAEERDYFPRDVQQELNKLLSSKKEGFIIHCDWCGHTVPRFRITNKGHIQHHYEICSLRIAEANRKFLEVHNGHSRIEIEVEL